MNSSERGKQVDRELTKAREIYRETQRAFALCEELVKAFPDVPDSARVLQLVKRTSVLASKRYRQALYAYADHVRMNRRDVA